MWTHPKVTDYISVCWDLGLSLSFVCLCVSTFVLYDAKFPCLAHLNVFLIICPQQAIEREVGGGLYKGPALMFDCLAKFKLIPEDSICLVPLSPTPQAQSSCSVKNFQISAPTVRNSQWCRRGLQCLILNTLQRLEELNSSGCGDDTHPSHPS